VEAAEGVIVEESAVSGQVAFDFDDHRRKAVQAVYPSAV
jgi:hypothetical protein